MTLESILDKAIKKLPGHQPKDSITPRLKKIATEQAFRVNELHGYKLRYNLTDFGVEVLARAANRNGVSLHTALTELL